MAITSAQLAEIREWIGTSTPPSDEMLEGYFDELDSTAAVARRIVRQRLADLRAKAAKFSADGDFTEDWSANIAALERLEARLAASVTSATVAAPSGGTLTSGLLVREGRCR